MPSFYSDCGIQAFCCTVHTCIHTRIQGNNDAYKKSETALPEFVVPARSNFTQPFNILCLSICLFSILFRSFSVHSSRISEQLQSVLKKTISDWCWWSILSPIFLLEISIQSRFLLFIGFGLLLFFDTQCNIYLGEPRC